MGAQIFKKQKKAPPSPLDRVHINEHFSMEYLDVVYNTLAVNYHLKIHYDTAYCRLRYFSYWFMNTPAPLAIEITTREKDLSYNIDSELVIYVKRDRQLNEDGTLIVHEEPVQEKYIGLPEKQNFTLSGKVVDFITGEALPFAMVRYRDNVVSSNADGFFTLLNIPSDTVTVQASFMGYKTADVYLNPRIQSNNFLIELIPAVNTLNAVEIKANKEDMMSLSTDKLSVVKLSPQKLAELPNIGEKDIMRAFQMMPGISAAQESSSGLYVRGGTPDQNLILYDGFTVYHVDHLYGFYSAFNYNALKDVQLYKGGFEAKYGGRLSSVMEITGKEGNQKKFNLGGDISLLSGNIFTEIPISEKISFIAAARKSWKGPIYNWIFDKFNKGNNSNNNTASQGPRGMDQETEVTSYFYDVNAKLTYRPTAGDVVSLSLFNGTDKLDNSFNFNAPSFGGNAGRSLGGGTTDLTRYGNVGLSLKWSHKWSSKLYSNTLVSYSNYYSYRERSNTRTITTDTTETTVQTGIFEDNNLKDLSIKSDYQWDIFKGNRLEFGVFATDFDIRYRYSTNDTSDILSRYNHSVLTGAYVQDEYKLLHNKLEIKPGIRLSYYDITKAIYKEPRIALGYHINDRITLRGSYGQYYQFANRITREDILSGSRDFWILSDGQNVPVSSAVHYIAGLNYETPDYLLSAETYYKDMSNISEYSLRFSTNFQNVNYEEYFLNGNGYAEGIELLAQKKSGKFTGWVSYTLGKVRNHFDAYGSGYYPASQDVTHEFKVVSVYKWKHWDFSATWIYATGRPYTSPAGSYSITLLDGTTEEYFTVTSKNSLRLPDYHRMDLAVNYHFYSDAGKDVGYIGLSVFNAYNRTNIWYKEFEVSDGSIIERNVNYLGITPNLTLSFKIR